MVRNRLTAPMPSILFTLLWGSMVALLVDMEMAGRIQLFSGVFSTSAQCYSGLP